MTHDLSPEKQIDSLELASGFTMIVSNLINFPIHELQRRIESGEIAEHPPGADGFQRSADLVRDAAEKLKSCPEILQIVLDLADQFVKLHDEVQAKRGLQAMASSKTADPANRVN